MYRKFRDKFNFIFQKRRRRRRNRTKLSLRIEGVATVSVSFSSQPGFIILSFNGKVTVNSIFFIIIIVLLGVEFSLELTCPWYDPYGFF